MLSLLLANLSLFRTPPVRQVVPGSMAILHITDVHADPFYDGARTSAALTEACHTCHVPD
jgi:hypothetical protein